MNLKNVAGIAAVAGACVGTYAFAKKDEHVAEVACAFVAFAAGALLGAIDKEDTLKTIEDAPELIAKAEEVKADMRKAKASYDAIVREKNNYILEAKRKAKEECYDEFEKMYHKEAQAELIDNMATLLKIAKKEDAE